MPRRPRPICAWHLPDPAPAPTGQAEAIDAQLDRHLVRRLAALLLLVPLVEKLGVRDYVNQHCYPLGGLTADLDVGRVVEVVVYNRLLAPRPLGHVETWLAETVFLDLLGLDAAQCNDERLARTLDALVPHLDVLWQDLIVRSVRTFRVDLSQLANDITSISFCGEYDKADQIIFGYSRDHRPDRLLARRAGLAQSATSLLEQCAAVSVLVRVFQDRRHLRYLTGLAPRLVAILELLSPPPAGCYVTGHG